MRTRFFCWLRICVLWHGGRSEADASVFTGILLPGVHGHRPFDV